MEPDSPSARKKAISGNGGKTLYTEEDWTLKEAMRTRAFWSFLFCVSIPAMVNTGIVFHLTSIFTESGLSRSTAALALSVMALLSFPFTFVAGFLNEKVKVHYVTACLFAGQVAVMVLLLFVESYTTALLFAALRGILQGFEGVSLNLVWPNYFGKKAIGSIKGLAMSAMVVGSAFGPLPFGIAFDWFGGYTEIILIMAIFPLLGSLAALLSPPPEKVRERGA